MSFCFFPSLEEFPAEQWGVLSCCWLLSEASQSNTKLLQFNIFLSFPLVLLFSSHLKNN